MRALLAATVMLGVSLGAVAPAEAQFTTCQQDWLGRQSATCQGVGGTQTCQPNLFNLWSCQASSDPAPTRSYGGSSAGDGMACPALWGCQNSSLGAPLFAPTPTPSFFPSRDSGAGADSSRMICGLVGPC